MKRIKAISYIFSIAFILLEQSAYANSWYWVGYCMATDPAYGSVSCGSDSGYCRWTQTSYYCSSGGPEFLSDPPKPCDPGCTRVEVDYTGACASDGGEGYYCQNIL